MQATVTVDATRFKDTLREYMGWTSRSLTEVCNEKAFFISRRATLETHRASAQEIKTLFGQATILALRKRRVKGKLGYRTSKNLSSFHGQARDIKAPLLAVIINARRGEGRGFHGAEMTREMNKVFNARMKSIGFIPSGFVPAIKKLEPFSKYGRRSAPPEDPQAKVIGKPKGDALPAIQVSFGGGKVPDKIEAKLWTSLGGEGPRGAKITQATLEHARKGLESAVEFERQSMEKHILDKMDKDAARFNAAT
jgi:hypothetical protein